MVPGPSHSRFVLGWDHEFESGSLQRGVSNELLGVIFSGTPRSRKTPFITRARG
jgi:hypothetical protein